MIYGECLKSDIALKDEEKMAKDTLMKLRHLLERKILEARQRLVNCFEVTTYRENRIVLDKSKIGVPTFILFLL